MASFRAFPMASSDQNSLRTPYQATVWWHLQMPPRLPLGGAQWEVLGLELGDPRSGCSSVPSVASTAPSPKTAAVSSVAKQEDWTRAQARLEGSARFSSSLNLIDHPAPSPKLGSPILPQLALCSLSAGVAFKEEAPRTWKAAWGSGKQVSRSFQSLIPGTVVEPWARRSVSLLWS